ncbi:hypothetical protein KIPB_001982 [Kipferlia bialata]|uniref:Uncharacterized protein n=1 Tax=Kipferlia bialata TaxID=797122 RepID=A0A9K3CRG1_9EUKA|nr:hypothetical protein KIPB_001982 [Kipferlia bialata]|eukprot:g1982.t1
MTAGQLVQYSHSLSDNWTDDRVRSGRYLPSPGHSHSFVRVSLHDSDNDTLATAHLIEVLPSLPPASERDTQREAPPAYAQTHSLSLSTALRSMGDHPGSVPTGRDTVLSRLVVPLLSQAAGALIVTGNDSLPTSTGNVLELAGRAKGIYAPLIPIAARRDQLCFVAPSDVLQAGEEEREGEGDMLSDTEANLDVGDDREGEERQEGGEEYPPWDQELEGEEDGMESDATTEREGRGGEREVSYRSISAFNETQAVDQASLRDDREAPAHRHGERGKGERRERDWSGMGDSELDEEMERETELQRERERDQEREEVAAAARRQERQRERERAALQKSVTADAYVALEAQVKQALALLHRSEQARQELADRLEAVELQEREELAQAEFDALEARERDLLTRTTLQRDPEGGVDVLHGAEDTLTETQAQLIKAKQKHASLAAQACITQASSVSEAYGALRTVSSRMERENEALEAKLASTATNERNLAMSVRHHADMAHAVQALEGQVAEYEGDLSALSSIRHSHTLSLTHSAESKQAVKAQIRRVRGEAAAMLGDLSKLRGSVRSLRGRSRSYVQSVAAFPSSAVSMGAAMEARDIVGEMLEEVEGEMDVVEGGYTDRRHRAVRHSEVGPGVTKLIREIDSNLNRILTGKAQLGASHFSPGAKVSAYAPVSPGRSPQSIPKPIGELQRIEARLFASFGDLVGKRGGPTVVDTELEDDSDE